jgi:hypothetical protein
MKGKADIGVHFSGIKESVGLGLLCIRGHRLSITECSKCKLS